MIEKTISSFNEYIDYTERYKGMFYFRGQKNKEWTILPTLYRDGVATDFNSERQIIMSVMAENPKSRPLEALYFAQHHGKPTRICDLTISLLNALCFASDGGDGPEDPDGAVFVIDKSKSIALDSLEVRLFSTVLTGDSQLSSLAASSLSDILTNNYVIEYKDFVYSNKRAFRQGGTGIIFGFGFDNEKLIPVGNTNIDGLIFERIIIPKLVKDDIRRELRVRGISTDMLFGTGGEEYMAEEVTLTETELETYRIYDKKQINKIVGKYKVSSVYFNRNSLYRQINELYKSLLEKYESDARIWTFFYFDDLDTNHANWICRGVWDSDRKYHIEWNNVYHTHRLMYQNEEISSKEALNRVIEIANEMMPLFEGIGDLIDRTFYTLSELKEYVGRVHGKVRRLFLKSQDIPFSDTDTEKLVKKVLGFIGEVDLLVSDTQFYFQRDEVNEKWIRYNVENTFKSCKDKASNYLQILQDYKNSK